jgi:hypothetical protein
MVLTTLPENPNKHKIEDVEKKPWNQSSPFLPPPSPVIKPLLPQHQISPCTGDQETLKQGFKDMKASLHC